MGTAGSQNCSGVGSEHAGVMPNIEVYWCYSICFLGLLRHSLLDASGSDKPLLKALQKSNCVLGGGGRTAPVGSRRRDLRSCYRAGAEYLGRDGGW